MQRSRLTLLLSLAAATASAQNTDEMARQVANPIASLTSVPVQFNDEYDAGVNGDGHRLRINVQPLIPISIGEGSVRFCRSASSSSACRKAAPTTWKPRAGRRNGVRALR